MRHYFHLVTPSPWPFLASLGSLTLTVGGVMYIHSYTYGLAILTLGLIHILLIMFVWWRDVVREATFEGAHTIVVQTGLKIGVVLFIVSEVMFFFAFFWAFFHSSLAPAIEIGSIWPPFYLPIFDPWGIPLFNTVILLQSGVTITQAHHALINGDFNEGRDYFLNTILYAISFLLYQAYEYINSPFSIWDGIYGSTFFMATGFHGLHVLIGTLFIIVCYLRFLKRHFTREHHLGFEAAAWYWHFVDVVWLFLFISIYWVGLSLEKMKEKKAKEFNLIKKILLFFYLRTSFLILFLIYSYFSFLFWGYTVYFIWSTLFPPR